MKSLIGNDKIFTWFYKDLCAFNEAQASLKLTLLYEYMMMKDGGQILKKLSNSKTE